MATSYLPLDIPPGVIKTRSAHAAKGRFTDTNFVRFVDGKPEKWKGWQKLIQTQLAGKARGAVSWANDALSYNIAIGTSQRLYVIQGGDTLNNITPIQDSGTLGSNPISTTSGSAIVSIADTAHARKQGDFVTFGGATAVGGITISGTYNVVDTTDDDNYTIQHTSAASSTATGGGASVTYSYELNIGGENNLIGLGWGAGSWGESTWGTPRTDSTLVIDLRYWSVDEYGNNLLASPTSGTLYDWEEGTDDTAQAVANAPASIRFMFVTGERFVFALGTTTPMTVQWPDQNDITAWTPSISNTANSRTLQNGSKLIAGTPLADEINLVWSDRALYVFQYTGSEFVYDTRLAGENCGLIGPDAFVTVAGVAYWMSPHDFHLYSGSVQNIPRDEEISDWVYDNIDATYGAKTWCGYNEKNNAILWGFVSNSSTDTEPDIYVELSLDDFSWSVGSLPRTTFTRFRPSDSSSVMVGQDGYIYQHEIGNDADGSAMNAYIQYGWYKLSNGIDMTDIMGFIPDCESQTGDLSVLIETYDRPNSSSVFDSQTLTIGTTTEIADSRVSGRNVTFRVTSNTIGGDFRLGDVALEVQSAGRRR